MAVTTFEGNKAYRAKEDTFFDDGREIELLHHIYSLPNIDELRGQPEKILAHIDEYGRTKRYLMNVGEDKGRIVSSLIAEVKPKLMLELGSYVGYSALLFGSAVKRASQGASVLPRYYSLERNPEFAAVVMSLVDLAGLSDVVKVIVGASDDGIKRLHAQGALANGIDMMFLDHYKPAYTTDLKLCEQLGAIRVPTTAGVRGTVLAADNVIQPGNPPYLEYVRSSVAEKVAALAAHANGMNKVDDRFADRTANQYAKWQAGDRLGQGIRGNPKLVYESRLVRSFEPTGEEARRPPDSNDKWRLLLTELQDGVEITECMGEELA